MVGVGENRGGKQEQARRRANPASPVISFFPLTLSRSRVQHPKETERNEIPRSAIRFAPSLVCVFSSPAIFYSFSSFLAFFCKKPLFIFVGWMRCDLERPQGTFEQAVTRVLLGQDMHKVSVLRTGPYVTACFTLA